MADPVPPPSGTAASLLGLQQPVVAPPPSPASEALHDSAPNNPSIPTSPDNAAITSSDSESTVPSSGTTGAPKPPIASNGVRRVNFSKKQATARGKRPGPAGWATGNKLAYLVQFIPVWVELQSSHHGRMEVSKLYNQVKTGFFKKFGFKRPYNEDDPSPLPDPTPAELDIPLSFEGLDEAEAARCSAVAKSVRAKLPGWFHHHGRYLKRSSLQRHTDALFAAIAGHVLKKPKRMAPALYYMREYFEERIRPVYEKDWEVKAKELLAGQPEGTELVEVGGIQMDLRRRAAERLLANEDDEFRSQLKDDIEEDLQRQKDDAALLQKAPETPKEYQKALEDIAIYLQPICDGLAERSGLAVTILLAGPIPTAGGTCAVRSVYTGQTAGATKKTWPEWDPDGYSVAEDMMLKFANAVFPEDVRKKRALTGAYITPNASGSADSAVKFLNIPANPMSPITVSSTSNTPEPPASPASSTTLDSFGGPETSESSPPPLPARPWTAASVQSSQDQHEDETDTRPPSPDDIPASSDGANASQTGDEQVPSPPLPRPRPRPRPRAAAQIEVVVPQLAAVRRPAPSQVAVASTVASTPAPLQAAVASTVESHTAPSQAAAVPAGAIIIDDSPSPTTTTPAPELSVDDFPEHCREAYKWLTAPRDWGADWERCVAAVIRLQRDSGFPQADRAHSLTKQKRPKEFKTWFQYGRKSRPPPNFDFENFPDAFWPWWQSMQPAIRGPDGSARPHTIPPGSWTSLQVPTQNGFYLVLVALFWWRRSFVSETEHPIGTNWAATIADVAWVVSKWDAPSQPTPETGAVVVLTAADARAARKRKEPKGKVTATSSRASKRPRRSV